MMPGSPGSVVRCMSKPTSHPAVTMANAVRNDRVNALGDSNCFHSKMKKKVSDIESG